MCSIALMILTFLITTAFYGFLLWLAVRRVSRHLQDNIEGVKAVTDHVIIPLLGRRPNDERDQLASKPGAGIAGEINAEQ